MSDKKIIDTKVDLSKGKIINLNPKKEEPNVFIEVTTSNKALIDQVGPDKLSQMFVPLAQVLTQFSEATGNKEMVIAFKNTATTQGGNRTMGIRFVHGEKTTELLGEKFIAAFYPPKKEEKKDEPEEKK